MKKSVWIARESNVCSFGFFLCVFVPLLCCDSQGHRVGYGKGFYDNFLGNCNQEVLKIGLSLFDIESSIDDIHEKDIALDICVTPSSIYYFK